MKKIILLVFAAMLSFNVLSQDQKISEADQKWLAVIEKMVASGRHEISTPVEARTQLLKDWAKKNGYTFQVTRTDATFHVELTKDIAKN